MIRIELQIGEQSTVDSIFGFARGYEDCNTGLYIGRSNLPRIPNRFLRGQYDDRWSCQWAISFCGRVGRWNHIELTEITIYCNGR